MLSLLKNIVIIVGLLGIAALGYFLYVQNETSNLATSDAEMTNKLAIEANDFLRRLNDLKAITLDTEVFEDPRFASLIDFSTPIKTEDIGRTNPFEDN